MNFKIKFKVIFRVLLLGLGTVSFSSIQALEDMAGFYSTYGPYVFGSSIKQPDANGVVGYSAPTGGIGFIVDGSVLCYFRLGVGLSYASTGVRTNIDPKDAIDLKSTQGTLYGSFEYSILFADGYIAYASNDTQTRRNVISAGVSSTVSARFNTKQQSAKIRAGVAVPIGNVEISPILSYQITGLKMPGYSEEGAGGETFASRKFTAVQIKAGLRFAEISEGSTFYPEIHAFAVQETRDRNVIVTARYIEAGPAFLTPSIPIPRKGLNVGGSITAKLKNGLLLSGGYDYESRSEKFNDQAIFLKIRILF